MKVFLNERLTYDGTNWIPDSDVEFNTNFKTLIETLESFVFLTEATVYYSSTELGKLISNIDAVEGLLDYSITNPIQIIRTILSQIESIDWVYSKQQRTDHLYHFVSNHGAITHNVNDTSLAEACEYKFQNSDVVVLINFTSSQFNEINPINILRSELVPPKTITHNILPFVTEQVQTCKHFHQIRKKRIYTWNSKHGENGKGIKQNKGEQVSPLECSQQEAAVLLEKAIGYRKTNELYSFDETCNKFMEWKCDSIEQNSFHGYYPINQDDIDEDIKEFLKKSI